jgi:predicted dehydrogenase
MTDRSSRREFLQTTAGAAGAAFAGPVIALEGKPEPAPQSVAPSDRVRFGIIGVGMQGSGLLNAAISLPGVECAAACDLYDGRHTLAREIAGEKVRTTRRYQELLDDKGIDCIVAAVPDHWHKKIVVDAVSAGKDVYCEKPMSHSAADGYEMVAAAQKSGRIVQVGSQRTSSALCAKAREIVAKGLLGDLSPANLDWDAWQGDVPKRPFDPNIFARWRCFKEYGTGVAGDLMVHVISGMLFTWGLNEAPSRAMALGGILHFKDGRNMPDVHASLFEYGEVPVYVRLTLDTEAPSYYAFGFPREMREKYFKQWHERHDPKPGQEPLRDGVTWKGPSYDDVKPHLARFFQAVKTREGVTQDVVFGHHAALACHMANESYFRGGAVRLDPATRSIKS